MALLHHIRSPTPCKLSVNNVTKYGINIRTLYVMGRAVACLVYDLVVVVVMTMKNVFWYVKTHCLLEIVTCCMHFRTNHLRQFILVVFQSNHKYNIFSLNTKICDIKSATCFGQIWLSSGWSQNKKGEYIGMWLRCYVFLFKKYMCGFEICKLFNCGWFCIKMDCV